jgi:Flp pilus assembly protein TadD
MARSFYRPGAQSTARDLTGGNPFYHEPSATWYANLERDGRLYQRRWRIGPGGQEVAVQESQVDYVMGSGNHARTFLHRTERGALLELPLGWYAEKGGVWAMSPGHDREYTLPPRPIAYECMFCHNAYPRIPAGHGEPGSEALYVGALPEGIDCQRCHGPGANHVRLAQTAGSRVEQVRQAIVNPARLPAERQMEVCMQCHLETTSLPLPHAIRLYGREPFGYRPGEPLSGFQLFFDHAPGSPYRDDFEIAHSAYRLRRSRCFLESAGRLTCTTCHNPHDIPHGAEANAHYNAVCGQCHATALRPAVAAGRHPSDADCVACHMPRRRAQDVVHAAMTDHLIARRPPLGDLLAPRAERPDFDGNQYHGAVVPYDLPASPPTADRELYLAVAQVTQRANLAGGLPRLAAAVAARKPARPEFYLELGQAWLAGGNKAAAIQAFTEAVRREPASPVAALDLADALSEAGQTTRAASVLHRALETSPAEPLLWYQLGIAEAAAGHDDDAIAAYRKAVALDPDLAEAHNLLGESLAGQGDLDGAEENFRRALQTNPDLPEALGNLGHLLAAGKRLDQAVYYFARSVQLKPNDAEVRINYSVTLAGLERFDEAERQIEAAVRADPKSPEARNFHGTLLARGGNSDEALREYLEATRLRPDFALAHLNAGRVLAAKGDRVQAAQHFREALRSGNENVQRQAAEELRRLGGQR